MKRIATGTESHADGAQTFRQLGRSRVTRATVKRLAVHAHRHTAVVQHLIVEHGDRLKINRLTKFYFLVPRAVQRQRWKAAAAQLEIKVEIILPKKINL